MPMSGPDEPTGPYTGGPAGPGAGGSGAGGSAGLGDAGPAGLGAGEQTGLRARRRRRIHDALSAAAITLFLERGFDAVSVAEIAAAAGVSKPTLFAYFPAKEDLILHRILDHRGEAARVVRARAAGVTPLAALESHLLAGLDRREPVTGLNDDPEVLAFHGLVFATPSLLGRVAQYTAGDEQALAAALAEVALPADDLPGAASAFGDVVGAVPAPGDLAAALAAAQIIAVQRVLARENWARLRAGENAAARHPAAVTATRRAFDALSRALPDYA
ncbi:transcriptional regulator, TetR family [Frankia torreyi]|uniref:Transcriptional regulator, TetR family n=1 Tax=Frankia torreyi TaxID=1856 RepID=A0A0D8BMB9_9ACTN|nr:transcriptional regulator, TetR family [Frankia torreyi]KQM08025.1 transcriptional regulator, TetR family [Frankia sp. CpI1-P]